MRIIVGLIAAASLSIASTAQAGGLSPEIMERPDVVEDQAAPATSSVDPAYIILGIAAALLIAAAINADNNSDDEEEPEAEMDEVMVVEALRE